MNETEKRREELLAQARNLYGNGRTSNPAIHPRCQGAYHQLYEKEEALPRSTFVLRVCVSLILFLRGSIMRKLLLEHTIVQKS